MYLVNTKNPNQKSNLKNAVINSLPSFDGLWFPENIYKLNQKYLLSLFP